VRQKHSGLAFAVGWHRFVLPIPVQGSNRDDSCRNNYFLDGLMQPAIQTFTYYSIGAARKYA
jgi:hypothetical protein